MKAQPAARYLAIVIALILIALGVLGGYELWLAGPGAQSGHSSLIEPVLSNVARLDPHADLQLSLIVGILLAIAALLLLIAVLKPRRTTHLVYTNGNAQVHMRPKDVARMLSGVALSHPEIRDAETTLSGRSAKVHVASPHLSDASVQRVQADVDSYAKNLQPAVNATVTAKRGDQ